MVEYEWASEAILDGEIYTFHAATFGEAFESCDGWAGDRVKLIMHDRHGDSWSAYVFGETLDCFRDRAGRPMKKAPKRFHAEISEYATEHDWPLTAWAGVPEDGYQLSEFSEFAHLEIPAGTAIPTSGQRREDFRDHYKLGTTYEAIQDATPRH